MVFIWSVRFFDKRRGRREFEFVFLVVLGFYVV